MLGLMGKKKGMTVVYNPDGEAIPVTVVEAGPCVVVQKKVKTTDGYDAIQLGFGRTQAKRTSKPMRGHFEKKGLPIFTNLNEFRVENAEAFKVGDELVCAGFKTGDIVHVSGVTKGRGFQGVMKRHHKHGGPASHGSDFHRRPGSIGMRTWPGHVLKNMKMPGHMGAVNVTTKNLDVVAVRNQDNVLLIRGAVPGARNGLVVVVCADKKFESRPELKKASATAAKVNDKPTDDKTAEQQA